ncbi:esterase/lipase family protein [Microlunatus sp. GCM10028923]|uniref:esterase/lipase family protein n=1 Tax=Microlunatus sp. GCM10028923 TaxID=3273400 RepID=UPI00361C17D3
MRRVLTLLATLAMIAGLGLATAAPAEAKPPRGNAKNNAVIFVHGFAPSGKTNCENTWRNTKNHFRNKGWTGRLLTFGYYSGDENCSHRYKGSRNTSIHTVGRKLAWYIYDNFTSKNKKVDVVAHSMGGLAIRSALLNVQRNTKGWPKRLYVEDVITMATPHKGTHVAKACIAYRQCQQLNPGSSFFKQVEVLGKGTGGRPKLPGAEMGARWTVMSSYEDDTVSEGGGVEVDAHHRIQYNAARCAGDKKRLEHSHFPRKVAGAFCLRVYTRGSGWSGWSKKTSAVDRAYQAAYLHASR